MFLKLFFSVFQFLFNSKHPNKLFSSDHVVSLFADKMTIITRTKKQPVFKKTNPSFVCIYFQSCMKRASSKKFCGGLYMIIFLCIFMKSMKKPSKSDSLPSISQSGVDFKTFKNKFLKALGLRVLQSYKKNIAGIAKRCPENIISIVKLHFPKVLRK